MNKCSGCGIVLQNTNKDELGFTPKLENKYCERCFKTIHYGTNKEINNLDNELIIKKINALNYFTFFITDFLNINSETIKIYKAITANKVLVINKSDLIPQNLILNNIKERIKEIFDINEVIFISAKEKNNLKQIMKIIEKEERVLFCGETSSGKSTLINKLFNTDLTTSKFDNTTLEFIKISDDKLEVYDTPGLKFANKDVYDKIMVRTINLKKDYTLSLNDILLKSEDDVSLTLFLKDKVKVKTKKWQSNYLYNLDLNNYEDIYIDNIGFIYVKNKAIININKEVEIRKSIIGGK